MSTAVPPDSPSVGTAAPPSGGPAAELMPPPPVPPFVQPAAPENADGQPAMPTTTPLSELATLRARILTLTELNNRLQVVRNIPAQLLRPPGSDPNSTLLTHGFKELGAIAEAVRTEKVQDALQAARKSEFADSSGLNANLRRETLKRRRVNEPRPHLSSSATKRAYRRPPSPESPQPYRETESKEAAFFPPSERNAVPVRLETLPAYIRDYNNTSKNKLHIVAPKKARSLVCPITLRFTAPNVATVYLTLDVSTGNERGLIIENATAIGAREQKPPHSQSDYMAFQQLSQQLAKVIRSDPSAPLQAYVALLSSYDRLFVDTCSNCQRVISAEGHVPPVVRKRLITSPEANSKAPLWDVRHVLCKYEPPPPQPNPSEHGTENEGDGGGENNGAANNA